MGLVAFAIIFSGIFTIEYQSGSLVLVLAKGLARHKVVTAKAAIMSLFWSGEYWLCYGITFGYNAFFWDNSIAENLVFAAVCWWVLGIMAIALVVLFSSFMNANTGVLVGTGGVFLLSYLVGMFPKLSEYMPAKLMETSSLLTGITGTGEYCKALGIAAILICVCVLIGIPSINKKHI